MPTPKLTPEIVVAAVLGFEQQRRRIDDQIAEGNWFDLIATEI